MARTKRGRGKTLSKELRNLLPLFWDKEDTKHAEKGPLWVKSQGVRPDRNESRSSQKPSLRDPSWLRGACATQRRVPGQVRCGKRKEELLHMNDLIGSFLCSLSLRRTPASFSLWVRVSALLQSQVQTFLCVLSHVCCVSNNKLCTYVYRLCLRDKCIFHWGKDPGENSFQPLTLAGLVARIPSFHPGYPGAIPGQGIKISPHATTHCFLTEITQLLRRSGPSPLWHSYIYN